MGPSLSGRAYPVLRITNDVKTTRPTSPLRLPWCQWGATANWCQWGGGGKVPCQMGGKVRDEPTATRRGGRHGQRSGTDHSTAQQHRSARTRQTIRGAGGGRTGRTTDRVTPTRPPAPAPPPPTPGTVAFLHGGVVSYIYMFITHIPICGGGRGAPPSSQAPPAQARAVLPARTWPSNQ